MTEDNFEQQLGHERGDVASKWLAGLQQVICAYGLPESAISGELVIELAYDDGLTRVQCRSRFTKVFDPAGSTSGADSAAATTEQNA